MLRIGLTGGIASGKSAAGEAFAALGVPVLDADSIARELVAPGQPLLQTLLDTFGHDLRQADGSLNRQALADRIFSDTAARKHLEALMHPAITEALLCRLKALSSPYAILMVPLLVETGMTALVDRTLVIDTTTDLQRQRLASRDGFNRKRIDQILAAQTDRATRLAAADDVINNQSDLRSLRQAVTEWHEHYLTLAKQY